MLDILITCVVIFGVFELIRILCPHWLKATIAKPFNGIVYRLPRFMQRPMYIHLKGELIVTAQKMNPLVAYPFLIFLELNLDAEFEKGGLRQVERAVREHAEGFVNILDKF